MKKTNPSNVSFCISSFDEMHRVTRKICDFVSQHNSIIYIVQNSDLYVRVFWRHHILQEIESKEHSLLVTVHQNNYRYMIFRKQRVVRRELTTFNSIPTFPIYVFIATEWFLKYSFSSVVSFSWISEGRSRSSSPTLHAKSRTISARLYLHSKHQLQVTVFPGFFVSFFLGKVVLTHKPWGSACCGSKKGDELRLRSGLRFCCSAHPNLLVAFSCKCKHQPR